MNPEAPLEASEIRLRSVIASIMGVPPGSITENSSSDNVEGWDSLKHMNLIIALEEEFGVTIPDEDAPNLTSYKLIRLVMSELGVGGGT